MHTLEAVRLASTCLRNLDALGVSVEEHDPVLETSAILSRFGKTVIHPKLDPKRNDFSKHECFWLIVRQTKTGARFGGLAARLENIDDESAAEYWQRTTRRHYPDNPKVSFGHAHDDCIDNLRGRVAYMGDLFFMKQARGTKKTRVILSNLLMLMHVQIQIRWDVRLVYSFLRERDIQNARSHMYHFTNALPDYQRWEDPPDGRSDTEYLLTLTKKSFQHRVRYFNEKPERLSSEPL